MSNPTIAKIYSDNESIHAKFTGYIAGLSDEQLSRLPADGGWSAAALVEHVAIVETGVIKICARLLAKAGTDQRSGDGSVQMSDNFLSQSARIVNEKLAAPEMTHPTGSVSVAESITKLDENMQKLSDMLPLFETADTANYKFPHPMMGDLSAGEWLVLTGGHKARHLRQIKNLVESADLQ